MASTKRLIKTALSYLPYQYVNLNREFYRWYERLERTCGMTAEAVREQQFQSLKQIVEIAYERTVFYKQLYDEYGFHPRQLVNLSDIDNIPVIDKELIRHNIDRMVVAGVRPNMLRPAFTSGTTGSSLKFYTTRDIEQREWASICFQWSRVGYKPGDGRVEFRGYIAGDKDYIADPYERVLRINVSRLNQGSLARVVSVIEKSGYRFLHGYPSALSLFAKLLMETSCRYSFTPQAILMASEQVHGYQLHHLRSAFPASRLYAHYGQAEKVALAGWAGDSTAYHFLPLYGHVAIQPTTNNLIGTSFVNDVIPMIRYRITDVASGVQPHGTESSPHLFPAIAAIDGRNDDYMFNPAGNRISPTLITFAFKDVKTFTACQLVQNKLDEIELIVESGQPESSVKEEFHLIRKKLQSIFTESMNIHLTIVPHIPRTASGKIKWIETRISR